MFRKNHNSCNDRSRTTNISQTHCEAVLMQSRVSGFVRDIRSNILRHRGLWLQRFKRAQRRFRWKLQPESPSAFQVSRSQSSHGHVTCDHGTRALFGADTVFFESKRIQKKLDSDRFGVDLIAVLSYGCITAKDGILSSLAACRTLRSQVT